MTKRVALSAGACACVGVLALAAGPALAGGGSQPGFPDSFLTIKAAPTQVIQGRPFEILVTGLNGTPEAQSDLVPFDLYVYLLAAKVGRCPTTQQAMLSLVRKYPNDTEIIFKQPVPEAGFSGVQGPFTLPLFQAATGLDFTGQLWICGYSNFAANQDAAWDSFGPITITPAIPASQFPSRHVTLGATSGCWPLAITQKEQSQGLTLVPHPARPMVFAWPTAGSRSFTMLGQPVALNSVWIGAGHTVIGRWHGTPDSDTIVKSPAPITAVVQYPVGWRLPPNGARLQLGAGCSSSAGL